MKEGYVEAYDLGAFHFNGCFIFSENGYNFMLSENGCAMIVNDMLLKTICEKTVSSAFPELLPDHVVST